MKIIFVTPSSFPYYSGGVETWMYNIIKRISNRYEIVVLSSQCSEDKKTLFSDIISATRFVHYETLEGKCFSRNRLVLFAQKLKQNNIVQMLQKEITSEDDVVICVDSVICGKAVAQLRKKQVFKFILSLRGPHADVLSKSYPFYKRLYHKWEDESIKMADLILANGIDTISIYKGRTSKPIQLMKNGVDLERFTKNLTHQVNWNSDNRATFTIVSVATLIPIKGVYKLIDSLEIYREKYGIDEIKVCFVGKGDAQKLIDYAKEKGVNDSIVCVGEKGNVQDYMRNASLNICLSGGSGLSMSMIEAMASKKPIVALDTPVYRQFDEYGKLCLAEDNPAAIADAIYKIYCNYDEYLQVAEQYYAVAEQYDWKIVVEQLVGYIEGDIK